MNRYQEYIDQLRKEIRYLRQNMEIEKPGSREWLADRREIMASLEDIKIMKELMASENAEQEKHNE